MRNWLRIFHWESFLSVCKGFFTRTASGLVRVLLFSKLPPPKLCWFLLLRSASLMGSVPWGVFFSLNCKKTCVAKLDWSEARACIMENKRLSPGCSSLYLSLKGHAVVLSGRRCQSRDTVSWCSGDESNLPALRFLMEVQQSKGRYPGMTLWHLGNALSTALRERWDFKWLKKNLVGTGWEEMEALCRPFWKALKLEVIKIQLLMTGFTSENSLPRRMQVYVVLVGGCLARFLRWWWAVEGFCEPNILKMLMDIDRLPDCFLLGCLYRDNRQQNWNKNWLNFCRKLSITSKKNRI